ncbi:22551_t:CDS:1, partial [Gigaspora rosea]
KLIAEEVHTISKRLVEGKCTSNLACAECSCRFFNRYMLLCRHIFHKQLCGANILTPETWSYFQKTFGESGIEVYQTHGIVEIPVTRNHQLKKQLNRRGIAIRWRFGKILEPAIN